jgi:hypothetical protein
VKYKELIDLGFKHIEDHDPVWKNEFGYDYFRVEYKLDKRHHIDWDVQKQTCEVITTNKDHDVLNRWEVKDLSLLKNIIAMFTKEKVSTSQSVNVAGSNCAFVA